MKLIEVYIKVFDGDSSVIPSSDCLCKIITLQQETFKQGAGDFETTETGMVAYVFNPETGQVTRERLDQLIIAAYEDEKTREVIMVENPIRATQE